MQIVKPKPMTSDELADLSVTIERIVKARLATAEAVVLAAREGHDCQWNVHESDKCRLCAALSAHDSAAATECPAQLADSDPECPYDGGACPVHQTPPTPVAAIFGTLGGDHTDAELLAMVDDVRGKGEREEPSGKRHCGSPKCDREPYSDDACDCCCSRCGPWREWREKRDDGVTDPTARKDPTT